MFVVLANIVLLYLAGGHLPQQDRARRQSSASGDKEILSTTLTLTSNSPLNCGTGLTHPGVFVLVEYCLVEGQTAGEWQLLDTVTMEPTGHSYSRLLTVRIKLLHASLQQIVAATRRM